ncbi:MAG: hypothetical protein IBJ09_05230 [Bacteroidia bacterium]|nr:hypothetical protein [Bacteroidia bacterium]
MSTNIEKPFAMTQFIDYLNTHAENVKTSKVNDLYYHVNVVADAYTRGFTDGKEAAKQDVIDVIMQKAREQFFEKANQVYLSAKATVNHLAEKNYKVEKIYIKVFHKSPKVIISVKSDLLLDDEFVEFAYPKIHEVQCSFHSLFQNTLDLSLIDTEGLDEELLSKDGFDYSEPMYGE